MRKPSEDQPGRRNQRGLLSIDAGTTGTRAAVVCEDGTVGPVAYRSISRWCPDQLRVEQAPQEIWTRTLEVSREVLRKAVGDGVRPVGVCLSVQRGTALLWDAGTGEPVSQAVVWQDRRFADELRGWWTEWDDVLTDRTGRPVGSRAPLLWATREIAANPAARQAYHAGRLAFGSVDSWLVWNFTGGDRHIVSATNAVALGAYDLATGDWYKPWVDFLDCPHEVLPTVVDDDGDLGMTDRSVLGAPLPILAALGDQHAALIGLGGHNAGRAVCMHGTGTFVDAVAGAERPPLGGGVDGVLTLVGWRSAGSSVFSAEAFSPTTGAALRWLCDQMRIFDSPEDLTEAAAGFTGTPQVRFVPTLAGVRTPQWLPEASGTLAGLSLSTTRAEVARAVVQGLAHASCDLVDGVEQATQLSVGELICGGGLSACDTLLQEQADVSGRPVVRPPGGATASLRGAAYLGGVRVGLWPDFASALASCTGGDVFEPALAQGARESAREQWRELPTRAAASARAQ